MEISRALVVCLTVGFLGLLASALGLAAEINRIKVSDVTFTSYHECTHPRSVAFALEILFLIQPLIEGNFHGFLGTSLNDYKSSKGSTIVGTKCYLVKPGVFVGSAVVSLVNVTTGIVYYLMAVSMLKKMKGNNGGATGYPNPGKGIQLA
ncbi:hypothetical protein MKX01_026475 [Papaver californicum]|nr:hypothetical protein MKX01_026475 [Papaver californicum]